MFTIRLVAMLGDGITPFVTGIADLDLIEVGGNFRLYSAARPIYGGGIATFDATGAGAAALIGKLGHSGASRPLDRPEITAVSGWQSGSAGTLILSAGFLQAQPSGVPVVEATGTLLRRVTLETGTLPTDLRAVDSLAIGGRTIVVGLAENGGQPLVWQASGSATLAARAGPVQPSAMVQDRWDRLALADLDGRLLVLASASASHRVLVLTGDDTDTLNPVQMLGMETGIGIANPSALATATVAGQLHALVAGAGSSSITVFSVGSDGRLTATDHVIDGLYSRFQAVSALETVAVAGRSYVLAGGADDGMALMLLLPGGRLLHLGSVAGLAVTNPTALAVRAITGNTGAVTLQLFAAGESAGIAQYALDLGVLAAPRLATGPGTLQGGAGNDLLIGGDAPVTLSGGAGDDILVGGPGAALMTGGAGADLFVLAANGQVNRITDYDPAQDRLDLSAFPMLRSLAQLSRLQTATGARLGFGATVIEITAANGRGLASVLFTDAILGGLQRMPLGGGGLIARARAGGEELQGMAAGDRLYGGAGHDTLRGGAGADLLSGEAGDDQNHGQDGNDRIYGGAGNDSLYGGHDNDRILGGMGEDRILGGEGSDLVEGEADNDRIFGDGGNDTLHGGAGHDVLFGGLGRDLLDGGSGNDSLLGGDGSDLILGATGNDTLIGGPGADTLDGGADHDSLQGGSGSDLLTGGEGQDTLDGGAASDTLIGGDGNDMLLGGTGRDRLEGGGGQDRLDGGQGNDALDGGTGNDTLIGGPGRDTLTGGAGADVFVFLPADDPGRRSAGVITDFAPGHDRIDLTAFGLSAAHWLDEGAFTRRAGQFRLEPRADHLRLEIDTDGDGQFDLRLTIDGHGAVGLGDLLI